MPPAPGLFSVTTGTPKDCDSRSAIARPGISAGPPAGNPMRSLIGRDGYVSAAISSGPEGKIKECRAKACCHSPERQRCCQRADSDVESHEVTFPNNGACHENQINGAVSNR